MKPSDYAKHWIKEYDPKTSLRQVCRDFSQDGIGSALVKDKEGQYLGLVTENLILKAVCDGLDVTKLDLSKIGLEKIVLMGIDDDIDTVWEKFEKTHSGRLVVKDNSGKLVGVLKRKYLERFSAFKVAKTYVRK